MDVYDRLLRSSDPSKLIVNYRERSIELDPEFPYSFLLGTKERFIWTLIYDQTNFLLEGYRARHHQSHP